MNAAFVRIKTLVLKWTNRVLPDLLALPPSLNPISEKIDRRFETSATLVDILVERYKDPDAVKRFKDPNYKDYEAIDLITTLKSINSQFTYVKDEIESLKEMVYVYDTRDLKSQVHAFEDLVSDFRSSIDHDQGKISGYESDIKSLRRQIRDDIAGIAGTTAAMAGTRFLTKTAKKVPGPVGKGLRFVLWVTYVGEGIVILGLLTDIAFKSKRIAAEAADMDLYTLDVAALVGVVISFEDVLASVDAVEAKLGYIYDQWNVLQDGVELAIANMAKAGTDIGSKQYESAIQDVVNAKKLWEDVDRQIQGLDIDIRVKDTEVDIDALPGPEDSAESASGKMEKIEEQLSGATEYPVLEFYKKHS
jgi:hypothetical protein